MTQKELLYVEDAIEHEKEIIEICKDATQKLDNSFSVFMQDEIEKHDSIKNSLMALLKEKSNE